MAEAKTPSTAGVPERWDTLGKRLQWVVENRRDVIRNAEDWVRKASAAAGRPIARQIISSVIKRSADKGGSASMSLIYAAALVDVPGIDIDLYWLATGRGEPGATGRVPADLLAQRRIGAELAREEGVPEEVIESVRRDPEYNQPEHRNWRSDRWRRLFVQRALLRVANDADDRSDATSERPNKAAG